MRREYLIGIVVAALVGGGVFAVYQFYLKERLEKYAEDQLRLTQLQEKYRQLDEKFNGTDPDAVITDVKNRVVPWQEAVEDRASFYNMDDFKEFDPVPDDELSYKLYYLKRAPEVYNAFTDYLRNEGKSEAVQINLWFRAPQPQRVTDLRPDKNAVALWLNAMQFGQSFVEMFIDANVISLTQLRLWSPRVDRQVLDAFTVGVEFEMTMADLVEFLDQLRFDRERYYDVNTIRIANPFLKGAWAEDPWLRVQMLLTMAEYKDGARVRVTRSSEASQGGGRGGRGGGLFSLRSDDDDDDREAPQRSLLDRIVRLFPF